MKTCECAGGVILFLLICLIFVRTLVSDSITLHVNGVQAGNGPVAIGVFNGAGSFPDMVQKTTGVWVTAQGTNVSYCFEGIPSGEYAVAVYQDLNGNKKLDKNFLGAPSEPHGFSNNPRRGFGPPTFEAANFQVNGATNLQIELIQ